MTVTLNRAYQGVPAGTTTEFPATTEAALIAQGIATPAVGASTALTSSNYIAGQTIITAGSASVVVTNPKANATTKILPVIGQATADTTLLYLRAVASDGFFTIYGNANATANVIVDWVLFNPEYISA